MALGTLCLLIVVSAFVQKGDGVSAWLVRQPKVTPWVVIEMPEVQSGAIVPANSHVVFHLPGSFKTLTREVLFGVKGNRVRYWGYCFPANYDPEKVDTRRGFPGLIFLSEKERTIRAAEEAKMKRGFSPSQLPTRKQVEMMKQRTARPIRHQLEVFKPNTMCYVMSEESLSIGLDPDNDRLNNGLENELNTNPKVPDSDGDGIIDGVEYLYDTIPSIRDTDGDSLIDGIEDSDWDGKVDFGETDPRTWDTDRDGLCDGFCRVKIGKQHIFIGEDRNLNGTLDDSETDPTLVDTDGDEFSDQVEYLNCLAEGNSECP